MTNEDIDRLIGYLGEVSAFLSQVKFKMRESEQNIHVSETVERYLDSFLHTTAPMRRNVDSQFDSNMQGRKGWTAREMMEMPFIKDVKYRYRAKDKIHEFSYRRDGYNEYFCSKDYEIAKAKARAFIQEIKQILSANATGKNGRTVDFVFFEWLNLKKAHCDERTWRVYLSVYKNHIGPIFGGRSIRGLLPIQLQPFFDKLHKERGKTCENAKTIMNALFEFSIANRFCTSNPMGAVIIEKHVRVPGRALNDDELRRFKETMRADRTPFGLAGLILLYSGIRGFELQSLTFDWNGGTFTVKNAKLKKSQKANPNNLYRTVPIFPALWELRERIETEEWIIEDKTLSDNFRKHWAEHTVKDLRHTFASRAREAGIDNELVNIWQGHAPGSNLTANTYTHFSMNFQKEQAKKLLPY